jgi:tetratricopeptide (TPR) repeat protein
MTLRTADLCDDATIEDLLATTQTDVGTALAQIEHLLSRFAEDPRLYFLKGSLLIGQKRFLGAHQALQRALEIEPGYDLARFQLGFFELTSGEAEAAIETWQPLMALPDGNWLRLFAQGLQHLAADRFEQCVALLRAGIAANSDNAPLNADMELIIDKCSEPIAGSPSVSNDAPDTDVSATSLLLGATRSSRRDH